MKRKWIVLVMGTLLVGLLSGCGDQLNDLLGKANDLLDEQLEQNDADVETDEEVEAAETDETDTTEEPVLDEEEVVNNDDDGHRPDDDQEVSVEELIQRGEYDDIDLPNGYPLTLPPDDWRLVEMIKDPEDGYEEWQGFFCFDTEIISTAVGYEAELFNEGFSVLGQELEDELSPDLKYVTEFQYSDSDFTLLGNIDYIVDDFGSSCATVYFVYDFND